MIDLPLLPADQVLEAFERFIKYSGDDPQSKEFTMLRSMISKDDFAGDDNIAIVEYFTTQQLIARVWRRMLTLFEAAVVGKIKPDVCNDKTSFLLDKLMLELQKVAEPKDPNIPRKLYLATRPKRRPRHR